MARVVEPGFIDELVHTWLSNDFRLGKHALEPAACRSLIHKFISPHAAGLTSLCQWGPIAMQKLLFAEHV